MFRLDHLPNQRPGEKTTLFMRRHWVGVLKLLLITGAAAVTPILVMWLINGASPGFMTRPANDAVASVFISIYYLAIITFFFQEFIDYYLDTWIVTTERIINIEQHGLFNRVAAEMHLAAVQDAAAEVKGPLRTFLDYGDVHIHSAGPIKTFQFKDIPHPERIRRVVLKLAEDDKHRHPRSYGG